MAFYLPRKEIRENYYKLKKNGIDTLLLIGKIAINGMVKNINPGDIGKMVGLQYNQAANGIKYLLESGLISFQADNIEVEAAKKMFTRGQGGYFSVHDVFAKEDFIKNINAVPKRIALWILSSGIGFKGHKKASIGLCFKESTLMQRAGISRPCRLINALKDLEKYFIIKHDAIKKLYYIKVKPEYLVDIRTINNYKATWSGLYYLLKENKYFIKSNIVLKDIFCLLKRYGSDKISYALQEAKFSWRKVGDKLPGYIHRIILENVY